MTAYVDEGAIDAGNGVDDFGGLSEPLSIAGVHLGTLRKGTFNEVSSDVRGTVLDARSGAGVSTRPPPFGDRSAHPDLGVVSDFIEQPFDADLGLMRLGLRDYDPTLGRFMQPDPLYLEAPELCVGNATACNLYAYAANNPVNFVDPWGLDPTGGAFGDDPDLTGRVDQPGGTTRYDFDVYDSTPPAHIEAYQGRPWRDGSYPLTQATTYDPGSMRGPVYALTQALFVGFLSTAPLAAPTFAYDQYKSGVISGGELKFQVAAAATGPAVRIVTATVGTTAVLAAPIVAKLATAKGGAPALRSFTAGNFRTNLARLTGGIPTGAEAHHVLPQAFETSFKRAGLNIHDPKFGSWWEAGAHRANASAYNQLWADFLGTAERSADEIFQFGRTLGGRFGFTVGF
ncbi:MAG: hypothetical protein IT381_31450 [Deltaproteobacteria bacterium]|nr:hypothetical protein [Deltaproteobacteria bacterium]